tara:strand:+ start:195 stop:806 length:612 start_codon:yes stop_codon:yes gene_type:complete
MLFYFIDMKVCSKCEEVKELTEFYKRKEHKDGLEYSCKKCDIKRSLKQQRTKDGKLKTIYASQVLHSKRRGYEKPKYTKQEFVDKYINNQIYLSLFINWVGSGYLKELSPSFDRLDDYKSYSFDNLRIVTWNDNHIKSCSDRKKGVNNKVSKKVYGTNIETRDVLVYHSTQEAGRNGFCQNLVAACCRGERNAHKGYTWSYKN